jgi:heat shock protein HspQ
MGTVRQAKYSVGQVVRHRFYPFRGVVFDIDPEFDNTEEWWLSIPEEIRPHKEQPFYHLLAENAETEYIAYVSERRKPPGFAAGRLLFRLNLRRAVGREAYFFAAGAAGALAPAGGGGRFFICSALYFSRAAC